MNPKPLTRKATLALAAMIGGLLLHASSSYAAYDLYLKFGNPKGGAEPINGDTALKGFETYISINSLEYGIENAVSIGSASRGGAGAGKAAFNQAVITKNSDKASPLLLRAVGISGQYESVQIAFIKAGGSAGADVKPFMVVELKTVFVASQTTSASAGDEVPIETIRLTYGAMQITYTPTNTDGKPDNPIVRAWNQITNSDKFTATVQQPVDKASPPKVTGSSVTTKP